MNKILALIKREFLIRVRTKGFLIGTILMPVFIILMVFLPILFSQMNTEKQNQIAVIDLSQKVFPTFAASLENRKLSDGEPRYLFNQIIVPPSQLEEQKQGLNQQVQSGKLNAFFIFPEDVVQSNTFELYSKNISNVEFNDEMERALAGVLNKMRMEASGLDIELVKKLQSSVTAQTFKVSEKGAKQESGVMAFGISYIMVFILYFALVMYGAYVMNGIIEDKNNRVVEMMVSSLKPFQYMVGKLVGIGGTGLAQLLVWAVFGALASMYGLAIAKQFAPEVTNIPIPSIPIWTFVAFIIFFVLGYFLYATLYATLGSMVNNVQEAQSLQWPVVMLIIIAFMLMFTVIRNPDSTLAIVLSMIPFFAPILMFLRVSLNAAPLYQVLASIVILVLTIWGSIWITAKIFRVGILMYGKKPTLPEVIKWIRYS